MAVLTKGETFTASQQLTSTALNNIIDLATFKTGSDGAVTDGGGLEVASTGRLQIKDDDVDFAKLSTDAELTSGLYGIMNTVYPVGSIYLSYTRSTSPDGLFFGGTGLTTWTAVGVGRVLVGIKGSDDNFDAIGVGTNTNGQQGASTHRLSVLLLNPVYQLIATLNEVVDLMVALVSSQVVN